MKIKEASNFRRAENLKASVLLLFFGLHSVQYYILDIKGQRLLNRPEKTENPLNVMSQLPFD